MLATIHSVGIFHVKNECLLFFFINEPSLQKTAHEKPHAKLLAFDRTVKKMLVNLCHPSIRYVRNI